MENTELIELELEDKRKLPAEIKDKIIKNILKSLVTAIIVMGYILLIDITYNKSSMFEELVKYYACVMAFISIIFMEIAYNKKSIFYLIISLEVLACCIISVYIPYIYLHTNSKIRLITMYLPGILFVYYIIKSFVILKKEEKKYITSLSDVKEILEDEKKDYLDEKSTKSYKKKLKEEEIIKEEIRLEQEKRKKKKLSMKKQREVK